MSSINELIRTRRTVHQFKAEPLEPPAVLSCLESAIWAPNHHLTQPWFFWLVGPKVQASLAHIYAELSAQKKSQACPERFEEFYQARLAKFLALPQVVLVGQKRSEDWVQSREDYAACACAIQNIQLSAWEQGIGVQWSTGPILQASAVHQLINMDTQQFELIGALYMGMPAKVTSGKRDALATKIQILE